MTPDQCVGVAFIATALLYFAVDAWRYGTVQDTGER